MKLFLVSLVPISIAILLQVSQPLYRPIPTPAKTADKDQYKGRQKSTEGDGPQSSESTVSRAIQGDVDSSKTNNQEKPPTDRWAIGNSVLLTVFTGFLAYLAHKQRQAMDRQADYMRKGLTETKRAADAAVLQASVAERTMFASNAADIMIASVSGSDGALVTTGTTVAATLQNVGPTKATDITVRLIMTAIEHYRSSPTLEQKGNLGGERYGNPLVLAPTGWHEFPFGRVGKHLSFQDVTDIEVNHLKRLWIGLTIDYKDVFSRKRRIEAEGTFNGAIDGKFTVTITSNT